MRSRAEHLRRQRDERWLDSRGFLGMQPNPFVDEVCVEAVAQRNAGNRGPGLGALLNNLGLEGFGVGTALWLHERPS